MLHFHEDLKDKSYSSDQFCPLLNFLITNQSMAAEPRWCPDATTVPLLQDYNGVMDNIMQQLLSRELMYDPIKQVHPLSHSKI